MARPYKIKTKDMEALETDSNQSKTGKWSINIIYRVRHKDLDGAILTTFSKELRNK